MNPTHIDERQLDLVLIDGLCVSCHKAVNMIHRHDPENRFRFASQQSPLGQSLIDKHGLRHAEQKSLIYLARGTVYTYSTAVLEIYARLSGTSRVLRFLTYVPPFVRDCLYLLYARNRYRWFGRLTTCDIPDPSLRAKFLDI